MPNLYSNNLWGNELHILDFEVGKYDSKWKIGTSITYSGIETNNLEVSEDTVVKNLTITGTITGITDKVWITTSNPANPTDD